MPHAHRRTRRLVVPLLGALLLAACDGDAADLARDIAAARGECDRDALRAGDEECVRMFERYTEMGTEAMHTYIGAMQAFDQALRRMPPADFDTTGLGHALSGGSVGGTEPARASGLLYPSGPSYYGAPAAPSPNSRDGWPVGPGAGYGDPYAGDPRSDGYEGYDPYGRSDGYGPYDGYEQRPGGYGPDGYDPYDDRYDPRDGYDRYPRDYPDAGYGDGGRGGYGRGYGASGRRWPEGAGRGGERAGERGILLPPEDRLRRPWLRDDDPRGYEDPGYRPRTGYRPPAGSYPDTLDDRRGLPRRGGREGVRPR